MSVWKDTYEEAQQHAWVVYLERVAEGAVIDNPEAFRAVVARHEQVQMHRRRKREGTCLAQYEYSLQTNTAPEVIVRQRKVTHGEAYREAVRVAVKRRRMAA